MRMASATSLVFGLACLSTAAAGGDSADCGNKMYSDPAAAEQACTEFLEIDALMQQTNPAALQKYKDRPQVIAFVHLERCIARLTMNHLAEAKTDCDISIKLNNDALTVARALEVRAMIELQQNNGTAALADINRIITTSPSNASAISYMLRGAFYESTGDTAHAIADFTQAMHSPAVDMMQKVAKQRAGEHLANLAKVTGKESPSYREPPPAQLSPQRHGEVPVRMEGGTYVVDVTINGALTLPFKIDSGATDVSIPADTVMTLWRGATLTNEDLGEESEYALANGQSMKGRNFRLRSLQIGDHIAENVTAVIVPTDGDLLLGQSFLSRFRSFAIDNARRVLVLGD
jgi:clan AA aspartic protease (TIGR02281 family)